MKFIIKNNSKIIKSFKYFIESFFIKNKYSGYLVALLTILAFITHNHHTLYPTNLPINCRL